MPDNNTPFFAIPLTDPANSLLHDEARLRQAIIDIDHLFKILIDIKAPLADPVFTGEPKAPTPDAADNSTNIATTEYVKNLAALYAPLANPTFTGAPKGPTAAAGTNTTQLATTTFVAAALAALVDASPGTLDTLNELAAALGDDPNFATTITNQLALKANKSGDTFTGNIRIETDGSFIPTFWLTRTDGVATQLRQSFIQKTVDSLALVQRTDDGSTQTNLILNAVTGIMTWKGNNVWTQGNDGIGSGLDADLLDGQQGAYYQNASNLTSGTLSNDRLAGAYSFTSLALAGSINISTTTPSIGFQDTDNPSDAAGGYFRVQANDGRFYVLGNHLGNGTTYQFPHPLEINDATQAAYSYGSKIWTQGNDGSGSGLDADLLDGQHASYFQRGLEDIDTIELGASLSSGNRTIDFRADGTTSDFNARIVRVSGVNGNFIIQNTGTGFTQLTAGPSGDLYLSSPNGTINLQAKTQTDVNINNKTVWSDGWSPTTQVGQIGSLAFCVNNSTTALIHGATVSGGSLKAASVSSSGSIQSSGTYTGTWRCLSACPVGSATLFTRIA